MDNIRVLIVDDHPTVRRGLKSLLSSYPDIEVVGEAEDGPAALRAAADLSPEIILLDIQLPGLDGIGVANQLQHSAPQAKVIALSAYEDEQYIFSALRAGAYAYLLKSTSDETLVNTIRGVNKGERLLSPALMDRVLQRFQVLAQDHVRQESGLSEEELKVLGLIAQGATNEEIAKQMYWSERTAKRKVEEITSRLNAKNRAQAVAEAIRKGLI